MIDGQKLVCFMKTNLVLDCSLNETNFKFIFLSVLLEDIKKVLLFIKIQLLLDSIQM